MANLNKPLNCYCGRGVDYKIYFPFSEFEASLCARHMGFYVGALMNEAKGRLAFAEVERVSVY